MAPSRTSVAGLAGRLLLAVLVTAGGFCLGKFLGLIPPPPGLYLFLVLLNPIVWVMAIMVVVAWAEVLRATWGSLRD